MCSALFGIQIVSILSASVSGKLRDLNKPKLYYSTAPTPLFMRNINLVNAQPGTTGCHYPPLPSNATSALLHTGWGIPKPWGWNFSTQLALPLCRAHHKWELAMAGPVTALGRALPSQSLMVGTAHTTLSHCVCSATLSVLAFINS